MRCAGWRGAGDAGSMQARCVEDCGWVALGGIGRGCDAAATRRGGPTVEAWCGWCERPRVSLCDRGSSHDQRPVARSPRRGGRSPRRPRCPEAVRMVRRPRPRGDGGLAGVDAPGAGASLGLHRRRVGVRWGPADGPRSAQPPGTDRGDGGDAHRVAQGPPREADLEHGGWRGASAPQPDRAVGHRPAGTGAAVPRQAVPDPVVARLRAARADRRARRRRGRVTERAGGSPPIRRRRRGRDRGRRDQRCSTSATSSRTGSWPTRRSSMSTASPRTCSMSPQRSRPASSRPPARRRNGSQ